MPTGLRLALSGAALLLAASLSSCSSGPAARADNPAPMRPMPATPMSAPPPSAPAPQAKPATPRKPAAAPTPAPESNIREVYFLPGSDALSGSALAVIRRHADRLKANRRLAVTLVGYADEMDSSSYGVALGAKRAAAVREMLVQLGVDPLQVRVTSFGSERPAAAPCADEPCRPTHQRVEFVFTE